MATERYHPLVATDLLTACKHYDSISISLGNRFRSSVQDRIRVVVDRPDSFGTIGGGFRGALVECFPYVVVFAIEDGIIWIYGVRHATSDQNTWFDRTKP